MELLWWQMLASFAGALFGSGSLWAFLNFRQRSREIQLSAATSTAALRKDLLDKLIELIAKSEEYADIRDGKLPARIPPNKLNQLNAQIELLRGDVLECEAKLAKLEGRNPRQLKVEYIRPSPPSFGGIE